jgi:hypothetical protein
VAKSSKDSLSPSDSNTPLKRADSGDKNRVIETGLGGGGGGGGGGGDQSIGVDASVPHHTNSPSRQGSNRNSASSNRNSNSNASARLRVFPHLGNADVLELVNDEFINSNRTKSPSELFTIGLNFELGIGVGIKPDLREAYKYFHLAASLHSSDALYRLGMRMRWE